MYIALNMEDTLHKNCQVNLRLSSLTYQIICLKIFLEEGFKIKEISAIICVAERTICRQVNECNLSKISLKNDSGADLNKKSA